MSLGKSLLPCVYFLAASILIQNYVTLANAKQHDIMQCTNYKFLGEKFRNVRYGPARIHPLCDDNLAQLHWYRFHKSAGNRMPSSHVTSGRCRAEFPGWVRGDHPHGQNVTVPAEVCFDIHKNRTCGASVSILITNCGEYFVYRLPRITKCSKVYCGVDGRKPVTFRPTSSPSKFVKTSSSGPGSCPEDVKEGITWPSTKIGHSQTRKCPNGKGSMKRTCSHIGWKNVNSTDCMSLAMKALYKQVRKFLGRNITPAERSKEAENIINKLSNITDLDNVEPQGGNKSLNKYDLVHSLEILQDIIKLNISKTSLNFIQPASNLLDLRNKKTWNDIKNSFEEIKGLMVGLEDYGFQLGRNLKTNKNDSIVVEKASNLELHVKVVKPRSYSSFHYTLFQFPNSSFNLTPNAFATQENSSAVIVVFYYGTLNSILTRGKLRPGQSSLTKTIKTGYKINGQIITASVHPNPPREFEKPVRIKWKKKQSVGGSVCVFFKPELNEQHWSTNGCQMIEGRVDDDHVICECNHLTAFASMAIFEEMMTRRERQSLEIISTVGCSLSLLGIILTIVSYCVFWTKLHSKTKTEVPSRVLMHICVAIGMTDIFAILAGPAHNSKAFCTTVSILLYFFVLSVFGWMLCEGIVIYLQLVRIFSGLGGKHLRVFYGIGWGFPIIVVALSVCLIGTKAFITEHACWFRASGPLLWTFIGTVGVTLLVNIGVFILALQKMLSSHNISRGSKFNKAKAGIKASAVLLPLLGLTWSFGLIVFNNNLIVFKYLFAIFNSLQGLMIFVFHVLVNKQIHDAIHKRRDLRRARTTVAIRVLSSKKKSSRSRTLSTNPGNLQTNSESTPQTVTGSLPQTPKVSDIRPKKTKYSAPLVIINFTNNNESKNTNTNDSKKNNSFDDLSLVDP